jgi:hypothetical protein
MYGLHNSLVLLRALSEKLSEQGSSELPAAAGGLLPLQHVTD